jgi:hypothetical protein
MSFFLSTDTSDVPVHIFAAADARCMVRTGRDREVGKRWGPSFISVTEWSDCHYVPGAVAILHLLSQWMTRPAQRA